MPCVPTFQKRDVGTQFHLCGDLGQPPSQRFNLRRPAARRRDLLRALRLLARRQCRLQARYSRVLRAWDRRCWSEDWGRGDSWPFCSPGLWDAGNESGGFSLGQSGSIWLNLVQYRSWLSLTPLRLPKSASASSNSRIAFSSSVTTSGGSYSNVSRSFSSMFTIGTPC